MRDRQSGQPETFHLTCPVCGALPGTSCIEDDQELAEIHPSRRMSIAERNYRRHASSWEPPELAERRRKEHAAKLARAPLGLSALDAEGAANCGRCGRFLGSDLGSFPEGPDDKALFIACA